MSSSPGRGATAPRAGIDLTIVVPVYRAERTVEPLVDRIASALAAAGIRYEVVLVNDGSPDRSWSVVRDLAARRDEIVGVDLRRNFGQDNAIMAGLRLARGRLVAIMDDDLQHDPADLPRLVAAMEDDVDVVYARFSTKRQPAWKNLGSWFNGKTAEWLLHKPRGLYLSPFKLLRAELLPDVLSYDGPYPYVDGLLLRTTSRLSDVPVEHHPRESGRGSYDLRRSLSVWGRVASSFSVAPLRLASLGGAALAGIGLAGALAAVAYRLLRPERFTGPAVGWTSLIVVALVIGGFQMLFLGVIGEYVGRSYLNVNRSPQAAIREVVGRAREGDEEAGPE